MADKRNCREYCRYTRYCYQKGEPGLDSDDCPTAWKIEEIINEAKEHNDKEDDE